MKLKNITNTWTYTYSSKIITINIDETINLLIVGLIDRIHVIAYDRYLQIKPHSRIPITYNLNYRAFYDPIYYRVILDLDVPISVTSHQIVEFVILN